MRTITLFETFDGKTHRDYLEAKRYLNKLYSDTIARLSHKLIGQRLTATYEAIDSNLDTFVLLKKIKTDLELTSKEDDRF